MMENDIQSHMQHDIAIGRPLGFIVWGLRLGRHVTRHGCYVQRKMEGDYTKPATPHYLTYKT